MAAFLRRRPNSIPLLVATLPACLRLRPLHPSGVRSVGSAATLNFAYATSDQAAEPSPGRKVLETFREEFEVGSGTVSIETGKIARFANGAVVITMDETNVLSTVASARGDGARDFLPLTVDYQEKQYAQGAIPTTFMRREGAPKERELLCGRLIDRPLRPLFPRGFYHEVQVTANVLSSDGKQDPDVMAANATSAALMLSDIPWNGPIGVIRVGRIDGKFIFNPTMDELSLSDLNLVYACTKDRTLMIDVQAREITEKDLQAGLKLAHPEAVKYIDPQVRLAEKAGKKKREYKLSMISDSTLEKIRNIAEAPIQAVFTDPSYGKFERGEALDQITQTVKAKLEEDCDEDSLKALPKAVDTVRKEIIRRRIIDEGFRVDGRKLDEVRPLYCESGIYPMLHGSSLFSRGDTQVLCTVTLGAPGDAQRLDSIVGPPTKRFMLHYSFPPFSINEVAKRGGLNRREVGHGTLAEKALLALLPPEDDFPYTVRVNSEVMASDGSTSMATVCGGSMALMDAGIPVREHVAGVSVGLISDVDPSTGDITDYRILTDILGLEDHLGDMDFKIAGTKKGITAIQLDIKPAGIPLDIICESLEPARKGRIQILNRMEEKISVPRAMDDGSTPKLATFKLNPESLRRSLGFLNSQRKRIEQETGARISVSDGTVTIVAKNGSIMEKAQEKITFLIGREIEVGGIYKGVISSVKEYGAFVEFNGGQQGLLHISELTHEPVSKVSDVLSVGQELSVMCIGQDIRGNIKLSLKATIPKKGSPDKQDPVPAKQSANVGVSPSEDVATCTESSTPSILIRSAAECEAQERAAVQHTKAKSRKQASSPRPYDPSSAPQNLEESSVKKKRQSKKEKEKEVSDGTKTKRKASTRKSVSHADDGDNKSKPSAQAQSLKIGDRLPAKVYQIRTHGLVLELSGGTRGMYKFEVNGRRDFEVGKELQVRCSSFSTKGIPVFSLSENE
ncbi:polyribonucleotide nucleotidyltransferase 2, mitochondrial-like [Zingiber officinale]|uniref:polyribonucleotide nucleotidyltransferase 2, mitochondrial-like n=1 Tax=Zingiber officinale TaxID=94328 RepID=UPI001C4BB0F4|nr:polyribonucleotide nucleotidyltransferase 2, mitochondrial-like [Zingiber officinale]